MRSTLALSKWIYTYQSESSLYLGFLYLSELDFQKRGKKTLMNISFLVWLSLIPPIFFYHFFSWIWRLSLIDLSHTPVPRCVLLSSVSFLCI